jgi:hypothetical protein
MDESVEPRIVEAVGTSSSSLGDPNLGEKIEEAMTKAVMECLDAGIPIGDSETILAVKQARRLEVLRAEGRAVAEPEKVEDILARGLAKKPVVEG